MRQATLLGTEAGLSLACAGRLRRRGGRHPVGAVRFAASRLWRPCCPCVQFRRLLPCPILDGPWAPGEDARRKPHRQRPWDSGLPSPPRHATAISYLNEAVEPVTRNKEFAGEGHVVERRAGLRVIGSSRSCREARFTHEARRVFRVRLSRTEVGPGVVFTAVHPLLPREADGLSQREGPAFRPYRGERGLAQGGFRASARLRAAMGRSYSTRSPARVTWRSKRNGSFSPSRGSTR
jgi:hypothetical protein